MITHSLADLLVYPVTNQCRNPSTMPNPVLPWSFAHEQHYLMPHISLTTDYTAEYNDCIRPPNKNVWKHQHISNI